MASSQIQLKKEIIKRINSDGDLFNGVREALNITPASLPMALQRNSRRLTELPVLNFLSEALGIEINELVEPANIQQATRA